MAQFPTGLQIEKQIVSGLESLGCLIQNDRTLDNEHKLDFVIVRYPSNPQFVPALGVQVTTRFDDREKINQFIEINKIRRVTPKAIYLEISRVDLARGGIHVVLAILISYQFGFHYANDSLMIARLNDDLSFDFRPAEPIQSAALPIAVNETARLIRSPIHINRTSMMEIAASPMPGMPTKSTVTTSTFAAVIGKEGPSHAHPERQTITGHFITFSRKTGYGFIQPAEGRDYFGHINEVSDGDLREELEKHDANESLYIPVSFRRGKQTNAVNIRRAVKPTD